MAYQGHAQGLGFAQVLELTKNLPVLDASGSKDQVFVSLQTLVKQSFDL